MRKRGTSAPPDSPLKRPIETVTLCEFSFENKNYAVKTLTAKSDINEAKATMPPRWRKPFAGEDEKNWDDKIFDEIPADKVQWAEDEFGSEGFQVNFWQVAPDPDDGTGRSQSTARSSEEV